jgi:hypothetical protein
VPWTKYCSGGHLGASLPPPAEQTQCAEAGGEEWKCGDYEVRPRSIASRRVPVMFVFCNALHQGVAIDVNLKLANVGAAVEGKEGHAG